MCARKAGNPAGWLATQGVVTVENSRLRVAHHGPALRLDVRFPSSGQEFTMNVSNDVYGPYAAGGAAEAAVEPELVACSDAEYFHHRIFNASLFINLFVGVIQTFHIGKDHQQIRMQ